MTDKTKKEAPPDLRPRVEVRDDLVVVCDEALGHLVADPDSGLYVRAGMLVRVARDDARRVRGLSRDTGAPVIEPAPLPWLRDRLGRAVLWWKRTPRGKKVRALVPLWVAENVAARSELPFPPLEGVVEAPALRRDGSLLDQPGYDERSALLYEPSVKFPPVPAPVAKDVAVEACARIGALFDDFPFVASCDLAGAVAAVLTAAGRSAIDGPCPLFAIRATAPGSGKTLLADVVSIIATGRSAARMAAGKDDDETRKLLLAIGLEGASVVLLDNVEGSLGSPAFAAALTSTSFADRILGASRRVTVSLRTVTWVATGNNLNFRGDLGRRVLPVDLDAGVEHPEDRSGFRHENLLAHVRDRRPALIVDALTVLRGYHEAGLPRHGKTRVGSFEAWDDLVRGAVVWAGFGDPVAGRERIREDGDDELEKLRAALAAWAGEFGELPVTVRDAVEACEKSAALRDALSAFSGRKELNAVGVGHALKKFKGRLADGSRFEQGTVSAGRARWIARNVKAPSLFANDGGAT